MSGRNYSLCSTLRRRRRFCVSRQTLPWDHFMFARQIRTQHPKRPIRHSHRVLPSLVISFRHAVFLDRGMG